MEYAERQFDAAVGEYDRAIALGTGERHYARYKRAITLGILGRTSEKQQALRQILADGEGDYVSEASYELGRSFIAQEKYAEGAAQLEQFIADYPSSPRRAQALSDLGLAYLNLGNREKSLRYYDMVVESAPQSTEAKEAMQGIREIYVSEGNADGYFDYAAKAGMESDLSALSRDSLSFVAAQNLYLTGTPEAAARSLKGYVDNYPKGYYLTDALYYLSDCYLRQNRRDEAMALVNAIAVVDPELLVIAGRLGCALYGAFRERIDAQIRASVPFPPEIRCTALAEKAGVCGAIAAAMLHSNEAYTDWKQFI